MKDTSDPNYVRSARLVKQFEDEYGEDWEGTMIDYDNDYVSLPLYVGGALTHGNLRTVLQWIGKGKIKERVNAKCEDGGNAGLLFLAAGSHQHDLMSYLLLNGADINILDSAGISMLTKSCTSLFIDKVDYSGENRMLLSWGAELFLDGKHITSQEMKLSLCDALVKNGYIAIANLMSSELGGRRCEIVSAPNTRGDLVGKTCVVEEYINESDQYKVTMEFTNESLLIGSDNLKRRDRTPQDPGYYVECKNNKLIRRDFKSNEECQAFIACLDADDEEIAAVDPEAEAKADQAAADLLAELGMDDLEDPSSNSLNKGKQSVPAGKKKKRGGGKKKGRK